MTVKLSSNSTSISTPRALVLDAWRGGASILMIIYHFCYDLNYFKMVAFDFSHQPVWLSFRAVIVTLFVGIVGISLHLATANGLKFHAFIKRLMILLCCAILISIISAVLFKTRFIFFGILHFIALASVLGLLFIRWFWFNLLGGLSLLVIGIKMQHPWFNHPILQWVGLMTYKPPTEDYVPLLPWFGIILLGLFVGKILHQQGYWYRQVSSSWVPRLAVIGQHSLLIYLVHQPLLMGGLLIVQQF
jgi:uncharacterized membrane protein